MATAFVEAVKRANLQYQLVDPVTATQIQSGLNKYQNILRYNAENPAVFDYANVNVLGAAQTGNGATTNYLDVGAPFVNSGVVLRIVTTIGATPTCTYQIQGSNDHTTWVAVPSADSATPTTFSSSTFVLTTATTKLRLIPFNTPYRYFQVTFSLNTNVTNSVDAFVL